MNESLIPKDAADNLLFGITRSGGVGGAVLPAITPPLSFKRSLEDEG